MTPRTPDRPSDPGLELGLGAAAAASYRVLARKYRPSTFDDLIGQDAMVRTISNAFETGRIPQAWILTGVRGVGKTTTARILARALNYELADGSVTGPTIKMPTLGLHCQAIMESRHIDVIEMDAASHNSVDDVRQINDAIRYAPVNARYKVYILDEVHMLSGAGLQRAAQDAGGAAAARQVHLRHHRDPQGAGDGAVALPALRPAPRRCRDAGEASRRHRRQGEHRRRARGAGADRARRRRLGARRAVAVRSGDRPCRPGPVRAQDVRNMLGLADRARVIDLFEALMKGDVAAALNELREQYDIGADPSVVLADLAEFTHFVTRVKVVPAVADDISLGEAERTRGRAFATALSMRVLSRTWQMLLKGIAEVQAAGRPIAAAEMVLVRIAYVADLPTPDEAIRALDDGGAARRGRSATAAVPRGSGVRLGRAASICAPVRGAARRAARRCRVRRAGGRRSAARSRPQGAPALAINTFQELVALASEKRDLQTKLALERDVRLVRCEDGQLEIALEPNAAKTLVNDLSRKLQQWTGRRWMVIVSARAGRADGEIAGRRAAGRARGRRARRPAGQGGAGAVSRRARSSTCARPSDEGSEPPPADDDVPPPDDDGFGDNWVRDDGE